MKNLAVFLATLVAAATVAACGGESAEDPPDLGTGPLLQYQVTSAAQRPTVLIIEQNGNTELRANGKRTTFRLPADGLKRVRDAVVRADFDDLEEIYRPSEKRAGTPVTRVRAQGREVIIVGDASIPGDLAAIRDLATEQVVAKRDPAAPPPPGHLLVYSFTGGEAGTSETLFIRPDGRVRVVINGRTSTTSLTERELSRWRHLVDLADIEELPAAYRNDGFVADGVTRTVTADGRTITVEDIAKAPESLRLLMTQGDRILLRFR